MISLRFFAGLREALETGQEQTELPPGVVTVGDLRAHLAARGGEWRRLSAPGKLRCAVNQDMVDDAAPLRAGDEVAFFPPVTGG